MRVLLKVLGYRKLNTKNGVKYCVQLASPIEYGYSYCGDIWLDEPPTLDADIAVEHWWSKKDKKYVNILPR